MKQFFQNIKQTFTSRELYQRVQQESAWKGFGFLMKVALIIGIIIGILGLIALFIFAPSLKSKALDFVATSYPDDLVVTIQDGTLSTNTAEPVLIPVPVSWNENEEDREAKKQPAHIFVLAPLEEANLSVLEKYDAFVVATGKAIVANSGNEIRAYQYPQTPQVFTKDSFLQMVSSALDISRNVALVGSLLIGVIAVVGVAITHVVWLFVVVLLFWISTKIRKQPFTYKQLYRAGMYALVPVLVIELIAVPFGFSGRVLTTVIVVLVLWSATKSSTPVTVPPQSVV